MAGSTVLSRLSSARLMALPLKLKSNKSVLPTISPLNSSSQPQVASSVKRISGISRSVFFFYNFWGLKIILKFVVVFIFIDLWQIFSSIGPLGNNVTVFLLLFAGDFRLPVELSCLISMMPLHSAVASSRLRSLLAVESQTWGLIPQGFFLTKYTWNDLYFRYPIILTLPELKLINTKTKRKINGLIEATFWSFFKKALHS